MKRFLKTIYDKFHYLILYGIIGMFSAGLDFVIYTLLIKFVGLHYLIANGISVLAGISTSFYLNRNYNFKVKDHVKRRFIMFLIVGLCGLLMSAIILYICIDLLKIDELISKVLSIVLVVFFQFLVNRYLTFKPVKEDISEHYHN